MASIKPVKVRGDKSSTNCIKLTWFSLITNTSTRDCFFFLNAFVYVSIDPSHVMHVCPIKTRIEDRRRCQKGNGVESDVNIMESKCGEYNGEKVWQM